MNTSETNDQKEFITLVGEMRSAQKSYFAARRKKDYALANYWLPISKQLEKQVDEVIKAHDQMIQLKQNGDLFGE